jgi:hypothetical protein
VNEPATPVADADVTVTVAVPRARFAVHAPVAAVHDRVVTWIWTLVPLPLVEAVVTPTTIGPPTRTEVPVRVSIAWTTKIPGRAPAGGVNVAFALGTIPENAGSPEMVAVTVPWFPTIAKQPDPELPSGSVLLFPPQA